MNSLFLHGGCHLHRERGTISYHQLELGLKKEKKSREF